MGVPFANATDLTSPVVNKSSNICIKYTLKGKYIGNNCQLNQFYVNLHLS